MGIMSKITGLILAFPKGGSQRDSASYTWMSVKSPDLISTILKTSSKTFCAFIKFILPIPPHKKPFHWNSSTFCKHLIILPTWNLLEKTT